MDKGNLQILVEAFHAIHWTGYVSYSRKEYQALDEKTKHLVDKYELPDDIRIVLVAQLQEYAEKWLLGNIPAFENRRPIDLIQDPKLINAVRVGLMRMPE